jgi:glycosyltransferase involved in cell wall biosynthesis
MLIGIDVRPLMHGRVSGVENYIRSLMEALFDVDDEHSYVLFYNSHHDCSQFLPSFDGRRVKVVRTKYPNKLLHLMWRFLKWPKIDWLIEKKLKRKIDVLFVPDPRPSPVSNSVRKVMTFHDFSFERYPQHFSWRSRLWFKILNPSHEIASSDAIIAVSEFTRDEAIDLYQVDEKKVVVVPEAVPGVLKPVFDEARLQEVKEKYHLPDRFFLTFSTLEPRKNLESVMKAFSVFQKKHPLETYRLVLAGRQDSKMFGKVFFEDHPDIQVSGFVDEEDKAVVYSLARGLVFVSTYEGFGLPVLEAMACGTPVIASSVASMPEVAGEAALLVDPYDVEAIADAMERLTMDDIHNGYIEKGLERVKSFSWKKAARSTLKVLTSSLKK